MIAAAKPSVREWLSGMHNGQELSREMAVSLLACPEDALDALLCAAFSLRQQFKGRTVTYSRKVFLPLTNLCRDFCGYCTFRRSPGDAGAHTMTPDEVLAVARQGERLGCREALFSLGDKPEMAFPEMRGSLRRLGYTSTLGYLEAMCELVLRETGLIPHANPGLLSPSWLARLQRVSPSMGLMLETTSDALLRPGAAHDGAPDKVPALRLATIEAAGERKIPFTTGILIGIGETHADRIDSLLAIRDLHRRHGHIQEVIIQNFRAKAAIPMSAWPEPTQGDMLRTIAVARLLLRDMNIQAPPNLAAPDYPALLKAGINDWGGISPLTPDFINPERPWPHVEELARRTQDCGLELRQRLPVYPEFLPMALQTPGLGREGILAAATVDGYARSCGEDGPQSAPNVNPHEIEVEVSRRSS
jgi:FO synthase